MRINVTMELSPESNHQKIMKEELEAYQDQVTEKVSSGAKNGGAESGGPTKQEEQINEKENGGEKEPMVTPTKTAYLSNDPDYSPIEGKLSLRVQSSCSLLGLAKLEGHEDDFEDDYSNAGVSAVTEEQDLGVTLSPSTRASLPEDKGMEDVSCMTTPPGSVQGPGIFSLSPPRLTTYSAASGVTSASVTESLVLHPRPAQSSQNYHLPQESPRFPRSPMVQHQPLARSRPPRVPHHHSLTPSLNNSGSSSMLVPRSVGGGTGPDSSSSGGGGAGGGHQRTPTDATNYSFLSSLTEATGGDYGTPRRRTLSLDYTNSNEKGKPSIGSRSVGVPSAPTTPGSILQPILLTEEEVQAAARPPLSIAASNLRKALPPPNKENTGNASSGPNTSTGPFLEPPTLPSQENMHPLIRQLHQISQAQSTPFAPSVPQDSSHDDDNNIHPLIQKLQQRSTPTKSAYTASTAAMSPSLQDEKKDDEPVLSDRKTPQYRPDLERRRSSGYISYASSQCSKTTISLQKRPAGSPIGMRGTGIRDDVKLSEHTKFDLKDILDATRESSIETEMLESIQRHDIGGYYHVRNKDNLFLPSWQHLLLAWGILNLGNIIFFTGSNAGTVLSLVLGVAALFKKELLKNRVFVHYANDVLNLRTNLVLLKDIAALSAKEAKDSNSDEKEINRFSCVVEHICFKIDKNSIPSLADVEMTRESFIEVSQVVFENLGKKKSQYEISFECFSQLAKRSDGSTDKSQVAALSKLLHPSQRGQVSKLDFVESMDCVYKTAMILIANMNNSCQIHRDIEGVANVILYTVALVMLPGVFGADANILVLTLFGVFVTFTFLVYCTGVEYLKGILRVTTRSPYGIGDRVHFKEVGDAETGHHPSGPPSGGWVIEKFDLYNTTVRHGITGEQRLFSNGSSQLEPSRVVNWKGSHKANVIFSLKTVGSSNNTTIARDQIHYFQRQISEWVESRPREWTDLGPFQLQEVFEGDQQQKCMEYRFVLRHRESWQNYPAVQESKSDLLLFLHELQSNA